MLRRAVAAGDAPNFGALLERGELVEDSVSSFPSVTPVCSAEIVTGARPGLGPAGEPGHGIMGMNWYHRVEGRYVEYGNSLEATRAFGLFRSLYDIVYNLNMSHLSTEVETVFEVLGDRDIRTACTPYLCYRGRTRHELGLEGLLRAGGGGREVPPRHLGPGRALLGRALRLAPGAVQADARAARHAR